MTPTTIYDYRNLMDDAPECVRRIQERGYDIIEDDNPITSLVALVTILIVKVDELEERLSNL